MPMKKYIVPGVVALCLFGFSVCCHANGHGMDSRDLLDTILYRFSSNSALWSQTMLEYARYLFWSLALISMVWTYGLMALRKADLQEVLAETVRFLW